MSTIADLVINVRADTDGASKGLKSLGGKLGRVGKVAGIAAGAAGIGALVVGLKVGIDEFSEATKVAAQTEATIKSTGGAAGVTAAHVDSLAGSLMRKSGVDDEAIASGENLLLTFTNIRNEAGKGNDIFDQATGTMLDMSVALGQDMKSSAVQLGKALNDPIKGVTALQRVGVSFTQAQRDQIKAMVESGNTMGAQKLILRELNKEFGGSAEAVGKTLPGQVEILKQSFSNLMGGVIAQLVPVLSGVVSWLTANWPMIGATVQQVSSQIGPALRLAGDAFMALFSAAQSAFNFLKQHESTTAALGAAIGTLVVGVTAYAAVQKTIAIATGIWTAAQLALNVALTANPIGIIIVALAALAAAIAIAWTRSDRFRAIVLATWEAIKAHAVPAAHAVMNAITVAWNAIKAATDRVWPIVKQIVTTYIQGAAAVVTTYVGIVKTIVTTAWNVISTVTTAVWPTVKTIIHGAMTAVKTAVDLATDAVNLVREAINRVKGPATTVGDIVKDTLSTAFDVLQGAIGGIEAMLGGIASVLDRIVGAAQSAASAIDRVASVAGKIGGIAGAVGGLIPGRARGGPVSAGHPYMVGERGPELFVPRHGGTILTNRDTRSALGGGGSRSYTVNVHGAAAAPMTEERLAAVLRRLEVLHA